MSKHKPAATNTIQGSHFIIWGPESEEYLPHWRVKGVKYGGREKLSRVHCRCLYFSPMRAALPRL